MLRMELIHQFIENHMQLYRTHTSGYFIATYNITYEYIGLQPHFDCIRCILCKIGFTLGPIIRPSEGTTQSNY